MKSGTSIYTHCSIEWIVMSLFAGTAILPAPVFHGNQAKHNKLDDFLQVQYLDAWYCPHQRLRKWGWGDGKKDLSKGAHIKSCNTVPLDLHRRRENLWGWKVQLNFYVHTGKARHSIYFDNAFPIQIEHTGRVTLLTQAIYVSKCSVRWKKDL